MNEFKLGEGRFAAYKAQWNLQNDLSPDGITPCFLLGLQEEIAGTDLADYVTDIVRDSLGRYWGLLNIIDGEQALTRELLNWALAQSSSVILVRQADVDNPVMGWMRKEERKED